MVRLGLALVLALACHLFLFLMILPEQKDYQPAVIGRKQVQVSIVRQQPAVVEEVEEVEEPDEEEPLAEELLPAVEKEVVDIEQTKAPEIIEPEPIEEVPPEPPPVTGKEKVARVEPVPEQQRPEDVSRPEKDTGDPRVEELQGPVSQTGAEPVADAPEVVGEAVPRAEINRPPEYPVLARRRGWEGTVMLAVDVGANGRVREVRIHESSSYGLLDEAALEAVEQWQFMPGTKNGRPIAMQVLVPVHFVLWEQR